MLGIDPGTHVCGWGVVERDGSRLFTTGFGTLKARASDPIDRRLSAICAGLREVVATHRPDAAAIEEVFYGRDVRAAIRLGEGRGAALVVLADARIVVSHYANNVVKNAVAGRGRAGKASVAAMTRAVLGLANLAGPFDASDALALAICHHHRALRLGTQRPSLRASGTERAEGESKGYAPRIEAAIAAMRAAESARAATS